MNNLSSNLLNKKNDNKIYQSLILDMDTYLRPFQQDENIYDNIFLNLKDREGTFEKDALIIHISKCDINSCNNEINTNHAEAPIIVRLNAHAFVCKVEMNVELTVKMIGSYMGYSEFYTYCMYVSVSTIDINTDLFVTEKGEFFYKKKNVENESDSEKDDSKSTDESDSENENNNETENQLDYTKVPLEIGSYFRIRVKTVEKIINNKKKIKTIKNSFVAVFGHLLRFATEKEIKEFENNEKYIDELVKAPKRSYLKNNNNDLI